MEQTYNAIRRRNGLNEFPWGTVKNHMLRKGWFTGKVRDLAGFGLGGLAVQGFALENWGPRLLEWATQLGA
jgi:hypothetical protein